MGKHFVVTYITVSRALHFSVDVQLFTLDHFPSLNVSGRRSAGGEVLQLFRLSSSSVSFVSE